MLNDIPRLAGPFAGDDVTTELPFGFKVFAESDLAVLMMDESGATTIAVPDVDFTVLLNANQDVEPGGTVNLTAPLPVGHTSAVVSDLAYDQPLDLHNAGRFHAQRIEDEFDRVVMQIRQNVDSLSRCVRVQPGETLSELPGAAARASRLAAFDASGNPTVAVPDDQSAAALALILASSTLTSEGGGAVGFNAALDYPEGTVGAALTSVVTLPYCGAAGDGVTDDATDIQAAITDYAGKVIDGCGLTYKVSSRIDLASGTHLRNCTLDFSGVTALDGSFRTYLKAAGAGQTDSSAVSANASAGDYTATVGDGTKFAAGDYVMLTAEDLYSYPSASVKRGEIKQVQSVAGNIVTFRTAIYEAYTTANTATLRKLSLLTDITLEKVKIIGSNNEGNNAVGLRAQYVRGLKIRGCSFNDIDLEAVALYDCIDFSVVDNDFDGVRYTGSGSLFYAVVLFNCCQWGQVSGNRGQEVRHLVTTSSSSSYYGQPYFVHVTENNMRNAMAGGSYASWAFENHGFGRWITWANNIADSCYGGINIEKGDQVVVGNIFRNVRYVGIDFDADGRELHNIIIADNLVSMNTTDAGVVQHFGVRLSQSASQTRKNIRIEGNTFTGFSYAGATDFGIRIYSASGDATGCVVHNNLFDGTTTEADDYGIYVEQGGWSLDSNHFLNYERAARVVSGADGTMIRGNEVRIASVSGTAAAIQVDASSCVVAANFVKGAYTAYTDSGSNNIFSGDNLEVGCTVKSTGTTAVTGAAYTVLGTDRDVICNRAGTVTLTLPTASNYTGQQIRVKTIQAQAVDSASSNVVPIDSAAAGTSILGAVDGAWATLKSDGSNWVVMASG